MSREQCVDDNPAVQRCLSAWQEAYDKKMDHLGNGEDECDAERAGRHAYLCALPPLSGYENIRDYIACVMHALVIRAADPGAVDQYLEGAKVALSVLRQQPQPKHRQRVKQVKPGKT